MKSLVEDPCNYHRRAVPFQKASMPLEGRVRSCVALMGVTFLGLVAAFSNSAGAVEAVCRNLLGGSM
jgi:hypothetical protein